VGYHCTRLTAAEVNQIRREGLRTLSPDLVLERLQGAVNAGEMSAEQCRFFLDHPMLHAHWSDDGIADHSRRFSIACENPMRRCSISSASRHENAGIPQTLTRVSKVCRVELAALDEDFTEAHGQDDRCFYSQAFDKFSTRYPLPRRIPGLSDTLAEARLRSTDRLSDPKPPTEP